MQTNFNLCKWSLVFKVPFTCTVDTKLRWFQFRLIHRILGTNSFLFKINKVDSNVCVFCKEEEETLIHLFCSCIYSINFWTSLVSWVKDKQNISLYLDNFSTEGRGKHGCKLSCNCIIIYKLVF